MENEPTTKTPIPTRSRFRNFALCTLIFAFSTYLSCREFIASKPPFLSMDYFSVIQSCIFLFFMHVFSIGRSQPLYYQGVMRLSCQTNFLVAAEGQRPEAAPSSLPSLWLFPLYLRVLVAISQLCKTNPISAKPKPTQLLVRPVIPTEGTLPACRSGGICFNTLAASQIAYLAQFARKSCPVLCKTNPIS